ncbi:MAG: tryptophan-rich sensory protein [Ruminococcus sp.]|nr:tryptophan-rich sensory protein [Ruminococcus sp.]
MQTVHNIDFRKLSISCGISLGVGAVSALVSMPSMGAYQRASKPPLTPPGWLFPIVWTILFLLMGISSYLVFVSKGERREVKNAALTVYASQLVVNFFYPIIFFNLSAYLLAFIWILILLAMVAVMVRLFLRVNRLSGALQIPYLLWVVFATYLTLGVFILN